LWISGATVLNFNISETVIATVLGWDRAAKRQLQLVYDSSAIAVAFVLALALRGDDLSILADPRALAALLPSILITVLLLRRGGLYRAVLRYITGAIMRIIIPSVAIGALALMVLGYLFAAPLPIGLVLIHAMLVLLVVSGIRFWVRASVRKPFLRELTPVIIYGAGKAGQQLVAALHLGLEYRPVAFVDDDARLHGATINGVPIHPASDLRTLTARWGIREILMAMPSLNRQRRRRIVSRLETLGVEVKTIPAMGDLVSGQARFTDLRAVTPEDLLGRDPVAAKPELMSRNITGKVVLVTGAGGTIGSELCRMILTQKPAGLVLLDVSEYALYSITTELRDNPGALSLHIFPVMGSVQNPGRMREIMRHFKVQTVFHAAAYKHVLLVEENLIEGVYNNVFGTRVVAEAAVECGVESFTLISTDKTVRPTNVMGATKRLAELICQALAQKQTACRFSMVRFGNVLGSSGSVIPRFRDQIERGGPVTVTHPEATRYFMTIPEAAQLVIQAGAMARGGDVFVLDMGQPVRILELAKSMIRLHGLVPYLLDDATEAAGQGGDIAIKITGLGHGEKLHEELLIAGNPQPTEHPRILSASEISMPPAALYLLLDELWAACKAFDLQHIQQVLLRAPLHYQPEDAQIHDMMWQTVPKPPAKALLRVVRTAPKSTG
jgi:FlaA1/EpsC-like NDP-sugar epimerase